MESTTQRGGISRSVRSIALPSCAAAAEALNIPRIELKSDSRMENIVFAAPTSMAPTAIGRTTLYQTVYAAMPGSLVPMRRGRSGSKNSSRGIKIHHAINPAGDIDRSQLRSDNVADADQRRGEARRGPRDSAQVRHIADGLLLIIEVLDHGFWKREKSFVVFAEELDALVRFQNLDQSAKTQGAEDVAGRFGGRSFTGL